MESFKKQRIEEEGATSSSSTAGKEMVERRVEAVSIEGDTMYHLDEVIDVEALEVDGEQDDVEDLKPGAIPDALWSDEPLNRTPPQPSPIIEQLADKVEEQRLKRMGVLRCGVALGHTSVADGFHQLCCYCPTYTPPSDKPGTEG